MNNIDKLLNYIKKYVNLTSEEEKIVSSKYVLREVKKKELYLRQGERCKSEAFILDGLMRVYNFDSNGLEHVLYFGFEEWWVGDIISFYHSELATFSIQALVDTKVLEISPTDKEELFLKVPALERMFRQITENHLRSMQNRFLSTISEPAEIRYLRLIEQYPNINQVVPQHQIASYLGILPESFSRLKKNMLR